MEEEMRNTILLGCMILALLIGLPGCDWTSTGGGGGQNAGNATGLYQVVAGNLPFFTMNIWQDGNLLKGQDSNGDFWEGQTGGDLGSVGSAGFQAYLETYNPRNGLRQYLRGDISLGTETVGGDSYTGAIFSGHYSRSDNAEDTPFRMVGPNISDRWGDGEVITD